MRIEEDVTMEQGRELSAVISTVEKVRDAFTEINRDAKAMFGSDPLCATIRGFCAAKHVTGPMNLGRDDRAVLIERLTTIRSLLDHCASEYLAMCGVAHASELSRAQYSIYCERLQAVVHREDCYPFPR